MRSTARRAGVVRFGILTCSLTLIAAASAHEPSTPQDRSQARGPGHANAEDFPPPSARNAIASPQGVPPATGSTHGDACGHCGQIGCSGGRFCRFDPKSGFFALGQPHQYVPPPSGWTVIVPPIPPPASPPKPGEKPRPTPPGPWKPLFYNNDFRYLDRPDNPFHDPFDFLKRISPTPSGDLKVDLGGEFRWQGRGEDNRRLTGEQNNFNLFREKLYLDAWYRDRFRLFVDVFWADASRQNAPPVFFDINHGDILNAFVEAKLFEVGEGTVSGRFGARQQLLFGNQRLVSPLDWANSPRTFDDVANGLYRSKTLDIDVFWSRPNEILAREFDKADASRQFFGSYLVYKGIANQTVDLYYLGLLESDPLVQGRNGALGDFAVHTLGTRWQGGRANWLWEVETAYQFGHQSNLTRNAGMATGGLGRAFSKWWARPELWFYYDYASGTQNPGDGYATFNQLFPLGHKYFGYMDIVGRQNILDPNVVMKFYPSKRVNFLLWYHHFNLASARDSLYNAAGAAIRTDPTGRAGTYVGDELDIAINLILNPHADWQFGASHFWAGPYVERTATTPAQARDGSFFYTQFVFRF
jgi:hypothetical protein